MPPLPNLWAAKALFLLVHLSVVRACISAYGHAITGILYLVFCGLLVVCFLCSFNFLIFCATVAVVCHFSLFMYCPLSRPVFEISVIT